MTTENSHFNDPLILSCLLQLSPVKKIHLNQNAHGRQKNQGQKYKFKVFFLNILLGAIGLE